MKKLLFFIIICVVPAPTRAAVNFDSKEYKPKGKHYTTKINVLYYSTYKNVTTDKLTLLYFKNDQNALVFKGFWVSKSLETKVPMVVLRYIGKYMTNASLSKGGSLDEAIRLTKKAIENALNPQWKSNLESNATAMVANPRYTRGNSVIDNNAYYEFVPSHLAKPDTTRKAYIEKPKSIAVGFQSGEIKKNLDAIIATLEAHAEHHDSKVVSEWPWRHRAKKWEISSDLAALHTKEADTCKLAMELRKVNKGETLPSMCWRQINGASWTKPPTYCNFFAGALAARTFNKGAYDPQTSAGTNTGWYPWGSEMTANNIHDYMVAHPELFVDLNWQDCWRYINAGYVVYFVWKNSDGAGHIATGYPTPEGQLTSILEGKVKVGNIAQAGVERKTQILKLVPDGPWELEDIKSSVRSFIYLGYLNF